MQEVENGHGNQKFQMGQLFRDVGGYCLGIDSFIVRVKPWLVVIRHEKNRLYSPINLAAIPFIISLVPAKIDMTRVSLQALAMGYSSQYPYPPCN